MKEKRLTGKIAVMALLFIIIIAFFVASAPYLKSVLAYFDLLLMFLYALVPCVPAIILRIKFKMNSAKWIALLWNFWRY